MCRAGGLSAVAIAALVLWGCQRSDVGGGPVGSGNEVSRPVEVGDFDRVRLEGAADLIVRRGERPGVEIRGDDNLVALVRAEVDADGWLQIRTPGAYRSEHVLVIEATAPRVRQVSVQGAGHVLVSDIRGPALVLALDGAANAAVNGEVDALGVKIAGAGQVDTLRLAARDVDVDMSGSASVAVFAAEKLAVTLKGAGEVRYQGNPTVTKQVLGAGAVRALPGPAATQATSAAAP